MVKTKLTSKGQVTIPKDVRESLGLKPRNEIEFVEDREASASRSGRRPPPSMRARSSSETWSKPSWPPTTATDDQRRQRHQTSEKFGSSPGAGSQMFPVSHGVCSARLLRFALHRLPVAAAFAGEDAAEGEAGEVGGGHEGAV